MMGKNLDEFKEFTPLGIECLVIYVEGREFVPSRNDIDKVIDILQKHQIIQDIQNTEAMDSINTQKERKYERYAKNGDLVMEIIPTSAFKCFLQEKTSSEGYSFEMHLLVDTNTPAGEDERGIDFNTVFYILEVMFDEAETTRLSALASRFREQYSGFIGEVEAFLKSRGVKAPKVQVDHTRN